LLPSLARLMFQGLVNIHIILGVKISKVIATKPVKVVNVYWLLLTFFVPHGPQKIKHRKKDAEINVGKFDSNLVHADIDHETNSWHELYVDQQILSEVIFVSLWGKLTEIKYLESVLLIV
jgi:hypothetical protein